MSVQNLREKVHEQMGKDLREGRLDPIEMQSINLLLANIEDDNELGTVIKVMSDRFPTFLAVLKADQEEVQEAAELDIQAIVSRMIKDDPVKANELASFAMDENVTLEELEAKFPSIKKYV